MLESPPKYLKSSKEGVLLSIVVAPNAKKNRIVGPYENYLKVAVAAPALEGRANTALVVYLSKILTMPKTLISVKKGASSKFKLVLLRGVSLEAIRRQLVPHS